MTEASILMNTGSRTVKLSTSPPRIWILAPCCTYPHLKLKQGDPYDIPNSEILFCTTSVTQHLLSTTRCEPNPNFYGSLKQSTDTSQLPHRPLGMLQETAEQMQSHFRQDQYKSFYLLFHYTVFHTGYLIA